MNAHIKFPRDEEGQHEILIYKIVCFPVIAKVPPRGTFSVCKSPAECLPENMSVGREGAIFFSLWQFKLLAEGSGGGSQAALTIS